MLVDKFQMLIGSAQPKYLIYFLRGEGKMKINEKIYSLRKKNNLSQEESFIEERLEMWLDKE